MKKIVIVLLIPVFAASCKKSEENPRASYLGGNGVFVVNEGNFMGGNGSLSFYSYDSLKIYNDVFRNKNGRPLGDVPNSMVINDDKAYIVVNNSGKIEVVANSGIESVWTIKDLVSPRNIAFTGPASAYVTSMYSDSLTVLDLDDFSVKDYINLRRSSESILVAGSKAYVACWVGGHEVMVINTVANEVIDSIEVGTEPESMVLDKNNMLWVLCNGGWIRENFAELDCINPSTDEVEKQLIFPDKQESPSCLQINGTGDILYYLDGGVRKMSIADTDLPSEPFIAESGHYFYKMGVDPDNGDIYTTDAIDYKQSGLLLRYNSAGIFISENRTGIIPGSLCFRISEN
jgi:YVTN family beta-propeller protein